MRMKTIFSIFVLSFICNFLFAHSGAIYTSKDEKKGLWSAGGTWDAGSTPNLSNNHIIRIRGTVTYVGDFTVANQLTFEVLAGDTLVIDGDFSLNNGATMTVSGVLVVIGNYDANNNLTITTTGVTVVTGNLTEGNGTAINTSADNKFYIFGTNTLAPADYTGTSSDIGNYSNFTAEQAALNTWLTANYPSFPTSDPLPIQLVSFNAKSKDGFVDLSWITESDTNNDFFTI